MILRIPIIKYVHIYLYIHICMREVYEGIYLMISRSWKEAAKLFLNVMPTFTATELVEFKDC